jgi:hypothetical protein
MYVKNEEYTDLLCDITYMMEDKTKPPPSHEEIFKRADKWRQICDMDETHPRVKSLIDELQYSHAGDCTCFAASCFKCRAESALGINTIKGLGQHEASQIMEAFRNDKTIDDAIEDLKIPYSYDTRNPAWDKYPREEYEKYIPRWETERIKALSWLENYKKEHNF